MKKILTIFLIVFSTSVFSQEKIITGNVKDEAGDPILGVTVLLKGIARGAVTDFDGNYSIKAKTGDVLVFSFIGNETKELTVGESKTVNVILSKANNELEEVVVIGYGTVKKSDLTGSVSSIKAEEITKTGAIGIEQALGGRAAGVVVNQASGAPGSGASITIRGLSSLNGSQPLYVIDGVPMDNTASAGLADQDVESSTISPLAMINPSDIESMEILKDASSTAVYGSRGANGVILITTKSGESGKGVISVDHDFSLIEVPRLVDLMDANQYTIIANEAYTNNGGVQAGLLSRLDSARSGLLETSNWQKTILRTGTSSNTNIGFSGGNKDVKYLISTNILNAEGIVKSTDLDRITTRANLNANISDKFKVSTSLNYAHVTSNQRAINTGANNQRGATSALRRAFSTAPTARLNAESDDEGIELWTPTQSLEANEYTNLLTQFIGDLSLQYQFNKAISFKTLVSHQNRITAQRYYQYDILGNYSEGGRAKTSDSRSTRSTITNTLNYKRKFGKHSIAAFLGQSLESSDSEAIRASSFGFENDLLTYYALGSATFRDPNVVTFSKNTLSSWFGRINYSYQGKYLATLTGRYEGSSKFAANNKWAFFPAAALAYKISKEKFMNDIDFINELKLRVSYGFSGNQAIRSYESLDQYEVGQTGFNETLTTFYTANQIPNKNLTWETTGQLDIGLDYGILNNKITGTFEYYQKNTTDLLFPDNNIPLQSGFSTFTENFGSLETKGFEMDINANVLKRKNFSWKIRANLGTGKTIITDMASDYIQSGWDPGFIPGGTQRLIIGEEVGVFYGYKTSGIAQFDDFVEFQGLTPEEQIELYNIDPTRGDYTFVEGFDRGVPNLDSDRRPGEQLYDDLDGNGTKDEADRQIIGNAQADLSFGITNNFKIGKLDVSFFFDSQIGKEISAIQNLSLLNFAYKQGLAVVTERWTPENPSNVYPRVDFANNGQSVYSDRVIEDGSFVRLQNITIGYSFPKDILNSMNLSAFRLYLSGTNLYTWTNYTGYSPDVSIRGGSTKAIGHDYGGYPLARTIRMGIKMKF
jgi:TonB-linked SusC/RagA family outer membrane protein